MYVRMLVYMYVTPRHVYMTINVLCTEFLTHRNSIDTCVDCTCEHVHKACIHYNSIDTCVECTCAHVHKACIHDNQCAGHRLLKEFPTH